jgi:acyl-CoA thioester hydrolase
MQSSIFHHTIQVQAEDLDELNHVNNVVYVRWVQEAAAAHWNSLATDEIRKKYFWVVLRHEIDYKSPALLSDEIIALTWVEDYDGARSNRRVQLLRKYDRKLLAESKTNWCLMNSLNGRPVRIGEDISGLF